MQDQQLCIWGCDEAVDEELVKFINLFQVHVVWLPLQRVDWVKGGI
jgi:hypothetical protein